MRCVCHVIQVIWKRNPHLITFLIPPPSKGVSVIGKEQGWPSRLKALSELHGGCTRGTHRAFYPYVMT